MSTIGNLFVGIMALIGAVILATGAVEGSSAAIIAGCFWLGFSAVVWFIGFWRDKADEAKDAMIRKFSEIQSGRREQETTTYEVIDAVPSTRERRHELMETKRELLIEEELEDEIHELEERRRSRMLKRGEARRRLGSG